ncbi:MAG: chloride channel protein [Gammaproteobacteria bacterium]|nr:chloride channel protein [Gammaproteobacteria bacterium]
MLVLAFAVGIITGLGAVGFRAMIGFVHNLLFFGKLSFAYDANLHTAMSPWGVLIIFIPVIGAIVVAWLVQTFAPEAKGHGVPEVMNAIYYNEGKIKPIVALIKSIASSVSIGSGGSVGREGPIIQIGAAFASTIGQVLPIPARQRIILIAAGAGAGIAATFNAPIGGLAFACELMLVSINATTVGLVAVATATATYVGRVFLGATPALNIPRLEVVTSSNLASWHGLLLFAPLGVLIGLASVLFIRTIYWFEDFFDEIPGNYYTRHVLGMFLVGVVIYFLMRYTGHYYVQGVGYATIIDILKELLNKPWLLLLLFLAKLLNTSLTLGSGASGGVFSPSLFLGATLGGAYGAILQLLFPHLSSISCAIFALAGMAAMISGSTGAVLTAIAMTFEMTRDYNSILPVIIAVALSSAIRKLISHESIYTLKLLRRGIIVPEGLQADITSASRARDVMEKTFQVVQASDLQHVMEELKNSQITIVEKYGEILGILKTRQFTKPEITPENVGDFIDENFIIVSPFTDLVTIARHMQAKEAETILVSRNPKEKTTNLLLGAITAKEISNNLGRTAKLMS